MRGLLRLTQTLRCQPMSRMSTMSRMSRMSTMSKASNVVTLNLSGKPRIVCTPNFPESIKDGSIGTINYHVGEVVEADAVVVEIETDKVVVNVPSPVRGIIHSIYVKEGDTVVTGDKLFSI